MARAGEVDKLITLVLTFQRRAEDLAKQAEVLQRAGGVSVVRRVDQCPTCNRVGAALINKGRARRCSTCNHVWGVE